MPVNERDIQKFLEEECYTTLKEKDPTKPFIVKGGTVFLNPEFDPSIRKLGTSIFLNFHPDFTIHQTEGTAGDLIRKKIVKSLVERLYQVISAQFPDDPPPMVSFFNFILANITPRGVPEFNPSGEVYLWFKKLEFKEDFILVVLKALKKSLEDEPIIVTYEERDYPVVFYGWGFRYI